MTDILKLTKWEFYKLLKTRLATVFMILLGLIMIGVTVNEYIGYQENIAYEKEYGSDSNVEDYWRERETYLISQKEELLNDPYYDSGQREAMRRRIEIAEYKLQNDIPRNIYKNMWYFFSDHVFKWVSVVLILFVAIVGSFSLSNEYTHKTINPLLILPYKRSKILIAKYLATVTYGGVCLGGLIILGFLSGLIVYGFGGQGDSIILYGTSGPYTLSVMWYSVVVVLLKIVELVMMILLAFMIAMLTKSTAVSTIITALMMLIVTPFVTYVSKYYSIFNYTPFTNSDFRKYLEYGSVMPAIEDGLQNIVVPGITPMISILILVVYGTLFVGVTYWAFCKKDI